MVQHKGHVSARKFFNSCTAPSYDFVVRMTTFGRDAAWKSQILAEIKEESNKKRSILDLACGTGILAGMAEQESGGRVFGLDVTIDYLQIARRKMPLACVQATAEIIPYRDATFDAVISSYLAKYVDLEALAGECWRVLAPGGVAVFHDFTCPEHPAMRGLWRLYFAILRVAGALFAHSWKDVFCGLDRVICESGWTDGLVRALKGRGFTGVKCKSYTLGTAGIVVARKRP
ncbi:MAG TPA: class I SAM-dependent methyltransferase [Nitrososphaera sp.]|nr:class I SAM-dependent methyltransferase [Nitrososphaera sp.]